MRKKQNESKTPRQIHRTSEHPTYREQLSVGRVCFGFHNERKSVEGKELCRLAQMGCPSLDEFLKVCHGRLGLTLQAKQEEGILHEFTWKWFSTSKGCAMPIAIFCTNWAFCSNIKHIKFLVQLYICVAVSDFVSLPTTLGLQDSIVQMYCLW